MNSVLTPSRNGSTRNIQRSPGGSNPRAARSIGATVKAWLADHGDRIEVFYLPSYAPELNPDERLNADLKHAIGAKVAVRTKAKLKSAAEAHMATIETSTERVKAYFRDPNVQYAA